MAFGRRSNQNNGQKSEETPAWKKLVDAIDASYPTTEHVEDTDAHAATGQVVECIAAEGDEGTLEGTLDETLHMEIAEMLDDELNVIDPNGLGEDAHGVDVTSDDSWVTFSKAAELLNVRYQQIYHRAMYLQKLEWEHNSAGNLVVRKSQILNWLRKREAGGMWPHYIRSMGA